VTQCRRLAKIMIVKLLGDRRPEQMLNICGITATGRVEESGAAFDYGPVSSWNKAAARNRTSARTSSKERCLTRTGPSEQRHLWHGHAGTLA